MKYKFAYFLSYLALLFSFVIIVVTIYWSVYPYNPLVFNSEEFPVTAKQVKQGQILFYTADYCKYMNLTARVTRSFVNHIIYVTPTTITNRPMGCNTIVIGTLIPQELPPGIYQAEMSYQFQVNPIRTITILHKTEEFEVIP